MRDYIALVPHADDYTLMDPFGGEPARGFDPSSEMLEALERFFEGDEAELELVESYASGTSSCWWRSNGSTAGSAGCQSRTCRSG